MNIGLVTIFFDRGAGNIALQIKQALQWKAYHNISILARMSFADNRKQIKYWGNYFHSNILLYPTYEIDGQDFENWVKQNKLDIVIFIEEQFTINLIKICNKLGIKTYNYVVWENINPAEISYYRQFTYLVCPTKCTYDLLKNKYQLNNAVYIQWGIDLDQYQFQEPIKKDKSIIFFPAGWGGTGQRKNEDAVLKSFSYICPRDKAILHIHTQQENQSGQAQNVVKTSGTVNINQLIQYYKEADVIILPSKFEGNGLPFIEASALGRPIITVDSPPMNERVFDNINGLVCKVKEFKEYQGIFIRGVEIDCWDFAQKMIDLSENKKLLYDMQITSRKYAEQNYNWEKNSRQLIDLLV